jgi:hypothetical protein
MIPLVVGNTNKQQQVVDTVIDTGFSGFRSLPSSIITALECLGHCHIGRWEARSVLGVLDCLFGKRFEIFGLSLMQLKVEPYRQQEANWPSRGKAK